MRWYLRGLCCRLVKVRINLRYSWAKHVHHMQRDGGKFDR